MQSSAHPSAIFRAGQAIGGDSRALAPWWSLTKTVLAAAVLKLAELGALDLDDRFEDWPVTLRQLLQHTSGLTTYGGPAYRHAVATGEPVWPVDAMLARHDARRLRSQPGKGWAYSNIGYFFIRQSIERVAGSDLDTALRRLIFSPLNIADTRVALTPSDLTPTHWGNHSNYDPRWVYHGLLVGPPTDAVAFLAGLLDGKILSPPALAAMLAARPLGADTISPGRPWTATGYGLGLMIGEMAGAGRAAGHSGVGVDTVSALYAFLDLPGRPIVAAFAPGGDEGVAEHEALRLALAG